MNENTNTTTMTSRQHYEAIAKGVVSEATQQWAAAQLAKIEERAAKNREKPSKKALENEPLKKALLQHLSNESPNKLTEAELGEALNVSHNKAGSLVRQLVAEGIVSSEEAKIPKIGKRKVYFVEKEGE